MNNLLNGARYLLAAHLPKQLPADGGREVAFAGRSNAGKSTALNGLVGHTKLARTSKTPGRTQQLVYFDFEHAPGKYLVDLPGYGYAKVPGELKSHWLGFINDFFRNRQALVGLVVVMDVRHPLREFDQQMLAYAVERGLPAHCLLTKSDKLSRGAAKQTLLKIQRELPEGVTAQLFSGLNKEGVEQAREVVLDWLEMNREPTA